jgi:adhesin transport system outer membrane protein
MRTVIYSLALLVASSASVVVWAQGETEPTTSYVSANQVTTDVLAKLSGIALQRSPQLHDAEAVWRAAQSDVDAVKGARWPHVDITATSKSRQFGEANPYGDGATNRAAVTLTYTLYDGGRIGQQISARGFQAQSEYGKSLQTREQIVFDTTNAYLQIHKYRRLLELHLQYVGRLELLVAKMRQIVKTIAGRRSELTQATARLLQARDNKIITEAKLHEYEVQLVKLVGAENIPLYWEIAVPNIEPVNPASGMEFVRKSHPILLTATADKQALRSSAEAMRTGNYWPTFDLQVSKMSGVDILGYSDPGQMFVTVKWNAFQGFSGRAKEVSLLERAYATEEKYQQTLLDIEYKLNSAWVTYNHLTDRIASLKILAEKTEQVRLDYREQWEALGRRTMLEVLTAENEHMSTLVSLASSEVDQHLAATRLRFESGTLVAWMFEAVP